MLLKLKAHISSGEMEGREEASMARQIGSCRAHSWVFRANGDEKICGSP